MKFFMYGMYEKPENSEDKPFDVYIGISARDEEEALKRLKNLVKERYKDFALYDIVE